MNSSPCTCDVLKTPWRVVNSADPKSQKERQEFPDSFTNLGVPGDGLLFFYRNCEMRLLNCQFCSSFFLYESKTADDEITEVLSPLDSSGVRSELDRVESWAQKLTADYPQHFMRKLPALLDDCEKIRSSL